MSRGEGGSRPTVKYAGGEPDPGALDGNSLSAGRYLWHKAVRPLAGHQTVDVAALKLDGTIQRGCLALW
jgi:hypothetical protein